MSEVRTTPDPHPSNWTLRVCFAEVALACWSGGLDPAGSTAIFTAFQRCAALRLAALVCLALPACAPEVADRAPVVAFTDVTLIDGTDAAPRPDVTVVVSGNRIAAVTSSPSVELPSHARIVEGRGKFLVPGLWDMHSHTLWDTVVRETFLPLYLANGVTGVRDMGGALDVMRAVRRDLDAGVLSAPRLVATAEDARRVVRDLAGAGVDFIKVYTMLPRDAFFAAVDEARKHGLPVAGHVPAEVTPVEASDAGMASIEHMQAETGGFCEREQAVSCDAIFEAFRRNGTWQVPTLTVRRARASVDDPALASDSRLAYVPRDLLEIWETDRDNKLSTRPDSYFEEIKLQFGNEVWLAGALHEAGIPLLAGSDAGASYSLPGFSLHDELSLLVEAGLSPLESLQAATSNAARFLGLADELGTIEEGKLADLVLLDADPLADIRNTRRIEAVMLDGRLWDRSQLDELLAGVRTVASSE